MFKAYDFVYIANLPLFSLNSNTVYINTLVSHEEVIPELLPQRDEEFETDDLWSGDDEVQERRQQEELEKEQQEEQERRQQEEHERRQQEEHDRRQQERRQQEQDQEEHERGQQGLLIASNLVYMIDNFT